MLVEAFVVFFEGGGRKECSELGWREGSPKPVDGVSERMNSTIGYIRF